MRRARFVGRYAVRRQRRLRWPAARVTQATALLAVGVLAGAAVATLTGREHHAHATLVAARPTIARVELAQPAAAPAGFAAPRPGRLPGHIPPVAVAIPVIGVRSRLVGLRLDSDGSLQVPQDYGVAGWYSQGPTPGDVGDPAIVVGHLDSHTGPGVFYRLPQIRKGDSVFIRRADAATLRFVVYQTADYTKAGFPSRQVYARTGRAELRLITCTGVFDEATGHYLSNIVVYAALAKPLPAKPVARKPAAHEQAAHPTPAHKPAAHATTARKTPAHATPDGRSIR